MELIKHEVYKIFRQKVIYIGFVIFVALYCIYFFSDIGLSPVVPEITGLSNIMIFNTQIGFYFIGGLTIIGLANNFSREYNSRMDSLIFSSKHGRKKIVLAKIASVLVYVSSVTIAFALFIIVLNGVFYGLVGWDLPLKEMHNFYNGTFYEGSILSFYVIQQLFVIAGSFLLGLFILLLSSLTKRSLVPAFLGGFVFLLPDILMKWGINVSYITDFVYTLFVYMEFIAVEGIGRPHYLPYTQLFEIDFYYEQYLIVRMLFVLVISCICIFYSVRKRQVV